MHTISGRFGFRPITIVSSILCLLVVFLIPLGGPGLAAAAPESWTGHRGKIPFSKAKMIIEFNSTANEGVGDVGVQVLLDGEPWQSLKIEDPDERTILNIRANSSLRKQGLTELFFESSEPSLDETPLADFLARFPEGNYEFEGRTIDGQQIEGVATFTHIIPAGPVIVSPEEGDTVDVTEPLSIRWETVTSKVEGSGEGDLEIVGYEVIVERTDNDELGAAPRTFDIKLAATSAPVQSATVPPEFLEPGREYKFEVLAIEKGGNQTISEGGPFMTNATP
ncbi:MAG: hypothetical protein AB1810_00360 [Pseudomonadota bacterium]